LRDLLQVAQLPRPVVDKHVLHVELELRHAAQVRAAGELVFDLGIVVIARVRRPYELRAGRLDLRSILGARVPAHLVAARAKRAYDWHEWIDMTDDRNATDENARHG
jgi:hypothetical protein